jgi:hypothetical protein
MDNSSNRGRPQGVMVPRGQLTHSDAPPGTIIGFEPVEVFAVRYVKEDGTIEDEFYNRMAGQWYRSPNGINYANSLKKLSDSSKMAKALTAGYKARVAPKKVPAQDGADVIGDS